MQPTRHLDIKVLGIARGEITDLGDRNAFDDAVAVDDFGPARCCVSVATRIVLKDPKASRPEILFKGKLDHGVHDKDADRLLAQTGSKIGRVKKGAGFGDVGIPRIIGVGKADDLIIDADRPKALSSSVGFDHLLPLLKAIGEVARTVYALGNEGVNFAPAIHVYPGNCAKVGHGCSFYGRFHLLSFPLIDRLKPLVEHGGGGFWE